MIPPFLGVKKPQIFQFLLIWSRRSIFGVPNLWSLASGVGQALKTIIQFPTIFVATSFFCDSTDPVLPPLEGS